MNSYVEISLPSDDEGFVLFQCPKCGEYFKLFPDDLKNGGEMDIHCPLCGLTSSCFFTEDVIEAGRAEMVSEMNNNLYKAVKASGRKLRSSVVKIKMHEPAMEKVETPLKIIADSMESITFKCCNRRAKIRYLLIYCGCYCPYCGALNDGYN